MKILVGGMALGLFATIFAIGDRADAQDQILLDTGGIIDGEILSEDADTLRIKVEKYGVIKFPKNQILQVARNGKIGATPTPTPTPTPRDYVPPTREEHSRLDLDYTAEEYQPVPLPEVLIGPGDRAEEPETAAVEIPVAGEEGTETGTGVRAGEAEAAGGEMAANESADESPAGDVANEDAAKSSAGSNVAAAGAVAPAQEGSGDPDPQLVAILQTLARGEMLEADDARYMIDLSARQKADPEALSPLEHKALTLMYGEPEPATSAAETEIAMASDEATTVLEEEATEEAEEEAAEPVEEAAESEDAATVSDEEMTKAAEGADASDDAAKEEPGDANEAVANEPSEDSEEASNDIEAAGAETADASGAKSDEEIVREAFGIDPAAIGDAETLAAMAEVGRKLSEVNDVSYEQSVVVSMGSESQLANAVVVEIQEQRQFARPNKFKALTDTPQHIQPSEVGRSEIYIDGGKLTVMERPPAAKVEEYASRVEQSTTLSAEQKQEKIEQFESPVVRQYDLAAWEAAGADPARDYRVGFLLNPFDGADLSVLKLEEETPEGYVFATKPTSAQMASMSAMKLHIGQDGILDKIELIGSPTTVNGVVEITNVQSNQSPADSVFTPEIPEGVEVEQKAPPQPKPAATGS